jgi:SAM-dependent methyltransferase
MFRRFFRPEDHPYWTYEAEIGHRITPASILLDAGCGRNAEVLTKFACCVRYAIGIDVVGFNRSLVPNGAHLVTNDVTQLAVRDSSVDIVISRSVMEHLAEPAKFYAEVYRILKPAGTFLFLTPNLWDYASLISCAIPNRWHPTIVKAVEGRSEDDTFPTYYRTNTVGAIRRLGQEHGLHVDEIRHLGQYPSYLMFSRLTFLAGTAYQKVIGAVPMLHPLQGWILAVLRKPNPVK